ncbi:MAG: N-acetyl-gamma-glutamyl-phosphate reductase [Rhodobacterales bacterium]|nr:N-acetyl-gamma-glutamyl-phosphate reductase [Rhodobacterales bacterium]
MSHKVAILGASSYIGAELVRLIATHPTIEIAALSVDRQPGRRMPEVFPHLRDLDLPEMLHHGDLSFRGIDLVFCALPDGMSCDVIADLPENVRIVDLSADFRLQDPAEYRKWYGREHSQVALLGQAVYGLTEFYRDRIERARLVAGTGCNAAAALYALNPLIATGVIDLDRIVIDVKTGVSGVGQGVHTGRLHAELSEGVMPFDVGGQHRELAECDQEFSAIAGRRVQVQFTPHLVPANRGILGTIYVEGDADTIHAALCAAYGYEPFIHVLPLGEVPSTRHVRGSNFVHIGVAGDRGHGRAVVMVALDNLTKGAAGQALQNANLMLGAEETAGLMLAPLFP